MFNNTNQCLRLGSNHKFNGKPRCITAQSHKDETISTYRISVMHKRASYTMVPQIYDLVGTFAIFHSFVHARNEGPVE